MNRILIKLMSSLLASEGRLLAEEQQHFPQFISLIWRLILAFVAHYVFILKKQYTWVYVCICAHSHTHISSSYNPASDIYYLSLLPWVNDLPARISSSLK